MKKTLVTVPGTLKGPANNVSIIEYWCRLLKQHLKNRTNVILKNWVYFCIYRGPHSYIHTFSKEPSASSIIRACVSMQVPCTVIMLGCGSNLNSTKIQEERSKKLGIIIFFLIIIYISCVYWIIKNFNILL
jgi:hypothetical protein